MRELGWILDLRVERNVASAHLDRAKRERTHLLGAIEALRRQVERAEAEVELFGDQCSQLLEKIRAKEAELRARDADRRSP